MATATAQLHQEISAATGRKPKRANGVDAHIALRLKAARLSARITQEDAAARIGVTFQQVQKYEKGKNRISCGTLARLAVAYSKNVAWFFEGAVVQRDVRQDIGTALIASPYGAELAQHFLEIDNPVSRKVLLDVAAALANSGVRDACS